jgi:hypothetical protein
MTAPVFTSRAANNDVVPQRNGFHVLEAHDWERVVDVVRVHSRPIHLLLVSESMDAHVSILKEHRSELQIMFVKKPVDADVVLAKVRQLLGSPPSVRSIRQALERAQMAGDWRGFRQS